MVSPDTIQYNFPKVDPVLLNDLLLCEQEKSERAPFHMVEVFNDNPNSTTTVTTNDNRTLFANTAISRTECKVRDSTNNNPYFPSPDIGSVSYLSDGKTLNTTFEPNSSTKP